MSESAATHQNMLEHFFGSKTRLKLLQIFFREPNKPFYLRELARLVDVQLNAIRREIANLEKAGLLRPVTLPLEAEGVNGTERSKYYQLDTGFILFTELEALLNKSNLLEQRVFIDEIMKRAGQLKFFMLSGIFTGAAEVGTDLLLVGDIKLTVVSKIVKDFEKMLGQPIRYVILTAQEFEERREIGDVFLYRLFEAKHTIMVDEYHL